MLVKLRMTSEKRPTKCIQCVLDSWFSYSYGIIIKLILVSRFTTLCFCILNFSFQKFKNLYLGISYSTKNYWFSVFFKQISYIIFWELTNCKNAKTYEISWKISSNSFETRQSNQTDKTCCKCHPKNPGVLSGIDSNGLNEKESHYGHGDNKLGTQNAVDFFDKSATNIVLWKSWCGQKSSFFGIHFGQVSKNFLSL